MKHAPVIFFTIFLVAHLARPQSLVLSVTPAVDTLSAGDSIIIIAEAPDDSIHPEHSQLITWTLAPAGTRSSLKTPQGAGNVFRGVEAYKQYRIILGFVDPANPTRIFRDTVAVYVRPGPPDHLLIEASPDSTVSLNADNRLGTLTFPITTLKDSVYAVLRDKYGNFVSHALLAAWASRNAAGVSAAPGRADLGEGIITRQTISGFSAFVVATQAAFKDSVFLWNDSPIYQAVRIMVRQSVDIDTIIMRTDQDTTLYACKLRDNGSGIWDTVSVTWGTTAGAMFSTPAPASASSWTIGPVTSGTGKIFITWGSGSQQLTDTIVVIVPQGDMPLHMVLYPAPGPPNNTTNIAYPPTTTDTAGTTLPLDAKLFSASNQWLSAYEHADVPISWNMVELTGATGSGVLDKYSGYQVNFTGLKAFQTVRVTATLSSGGVYVSASITISIFRIPASKLVIEPDSLGQYTYPNQEHRAGQITLLATPTSVFAVVRDEYGNFVRFSDSTVWTSRDTSVVKVAGGNASMREGILTRPATGAVGQAYVVAQNKSNPALRDSVLVVLANCCSYNTLRIVIRDSSRISSLTMFVGSDTTLKVLGNSSAMQGWFPVNANWSVTPGLKNATPPPASSTSWIFAPTDTGSGWIKVTMIDAASDSLFVTVLASTGLSFNSRGRCGPVLSVVVPNAGAYTFPLPADIAHSRLFLAFYSILGKTVFKTEVVDAEKPVSVVSFVQPGIYIINVKTTERLLVKSRFVIVK